MSDPSKSFGEIETNDNQKEESIRGIWRMKKTSEPIFSNF